MRRLFRSALAVVVCGACSTRGDTLASATSADYDVVISNGRVVDGTGSAWFWGELAVKNGRIARVAPRGALAGATATRRIDAGGFVVAPGFIDIQAQSYENFMIGDGRALSSVTQGITTAILGEGETPAPVNDQTLSLTTDTSMRRLAPQFTGAHGFGHWLDFMVARGLSQNVGSFVAPVATSNSPICGRVKLPQRTCAGRGEATSPSTASQYGRPLL